ncbi:MAG TPA: L,D-transpeptidase family protein, partial [Nitrospiria bacterium]|nr:L,D-transpeptidase family protein [Nitrospiria bacterium]
MCRIRDRSTSRHRLRLTALCIFLFSLSGCASMRSVLTAWPFPGHREKEIERNRFPVARGEDVIGRLAIVRLEQGDTLPDIARHFSLGINEIRAANPGVDVWVPEAGERVTLPLSFILPDTPRIGIVVNLAAMRLFQYKKVGTSLLVTTYPIGIGTGERPTPTGTMYVARKAVRPTWYVPASIAEEHRKKGDILPAAVPPGPDNPLGDYALYLSKSGYLIHGTNKPASIGLTATNGCLRLYPEDVKTLFDDTPVKTPVLI